MSELSREEIAARRMFYASIEDDKAVALCDMAEKWRQSQEAGMMSVPNGNPLLWNVHRMYQQELRDEAWEMQWRQLLAAIEQHLQRIGYAAPAPTDQVAHGDASQP